MHRHADFPATLVPLMARESPTQATQTWRPRSSATIAVEPESYDGIERLLRMPSSMLTIARRRCSDGSFISAFGSASSASTRAYAAYSEITSPLRPWPSYTAISICVGSSASGYEITPRSWLIFAVVPEKGPAYAGERGREGRVSRRARRQRERRGRADSAKEEKSNLWGF